MNYFFLVRNLVIASTMSEDLASMKLMRVSCDFLMKLGFFYWYDSFLALVKV
jgi:hypothetical protein